MSGDFDLGQRFESLLNAKLSLDMTRGKPCPEQLDLSADIADISPYGAPSDPVETRNYGYLEGIPVAQELFAEYLEVQPDEILVEGNSSLALMHDVIVQALLKGVPGVNIPWSKLSDGSASPRFLCPVPGYDRHFTICARYGISMIPVRMLDDGPDMDRVEELVKKDSKIVGIWCVPKYSNPTGTVYSDKVVDRLASMQTRARDFRIFWDNSYAVHHLGGGPAPLKNILQACRDAGHPDRPILFGSTSKITLPGSGVAMIAGSQANIGWFREGLRAQTIGPDKLNQLRHVRFLRDMPTILEHMERHAKILAPKFAAVIEILDRELGDTNLARWTRPQGGYFISVDVPGHASQVVDLAARAGVRLTPAGATFPYGKDPSDSNIRLAPSFPSIEELRQATELFCVCVKLASAGKRFRL